MQTNLPDYLLYYKRNTTLETAELLGTTRWTGNIAVADGNGNAYLQIMSRCTESNLIGSRHGSNVLYISTAYLCVRRPRKSLVAHFQRLTMRT